MKAIFDSNFKKFIERPDNNLIIIGFTLFNRKKDNGVDSIVESKVLYDSISAIYRKNENKLDLFIDTSDVFSLYYKTSSSTIDSNGKTKTTQTDLSDYKTVNIIRVYYKIEGSDTNYYFEISNDDLSSIRLSSDNNLFSITLPEDITIKGGLYSKNQSSDTLYLESPGTEKIWNVMYLDYINDTEDKMISKLSFEKYILSRNSELGYNTAWLDESGKSQSDNYNFKVYKSDSFIAGVSDLTSLNIPTKLHLKRDSNGSVKVHGVVDYTEYNVCKGIITEVCSGTSEISGIDGLEIICDEKSDSFDATVDGILYNIDYKECDTRVPSSEIPYGIYHLKLSYYNENTKKVSTIESNQFKLLQSGDVDVFNIKTNTDYSENNIPVYLLNYKINSSISFESTLFTESTPDDIKNNLYILYPGDSISNNEIIPGIYREYMESIFDIKCDITTLDQGEIKIVTHLTARTENTDENHWLPFIEGVSMPVLSTIQIFANGTSYSTKFYIIQKANTSEIEFHDDNTEAKNTIYIEDGKTSKPVAISLVQDDEVKKEVSSNVYWKLVDSYIIKTETSEDGSIVVVTDSDGNPIHEEAKVSISPDYGDINKEIPSTKIILQDDGSYKEVDKVWPDDYITFNIESSVMSDNTNSIPLGTLKFLKLSEESYSRDTDSSEIDINSWRVVALSSEVDVNVFRKGQNPYIKIYNSSDSDVEISEIDVYEVNSYLLNIRSNSGYKMSWEFDKTNSKLSSVTNDFYTSLTELANGYNFDEETGFSILAYKKAISFYGNISESLSQELSEYTQSNFDNTVGNNEYFNLRFIHSIPGSGTRYKLGTIILTDTYNGSCTKELIVYQNLDFTSRETRTNKITPIKDNPKFFYISNNFIQNDFINTGTTGHYHITASKEVSVLKKNVIGSINNMSLSIEKTCRDSAHEETDSSVLIDINGKIYFDRVSPIFGLNKEGVPTYFYHDFVVRSNAYDKSKTSYPISPSISLDFTLDNISDSTTYYIFPLGDKRGSSINYWFFNWDDLSTSDFGDDGDGDEKKLTRHYDYTVKGTGVNFFAGNNRIYNYYLPTNKAASIKSGINFCFGVSGTTDSGSNIRYGYDYVDGKSSILAIEEKDGTSVSRPSSDSTAEHFSIENKKFVKTVYGSEKTSVYNPSTKSWCPSLYFERVPNQTNDNEPRLMMPTIIDIKDANVDVLNDSCINGTIYFFGTTTKWDNLVNSEYFSIDSVGDANLLKGYVYEQFNKYTLNISQAVTPNYYIKSVPSNIPLDGVTSKSFIIYPTGGNDIDLNSSVSVTKGYPTDWWEDSSKFSESFLKVTKVNINSGTGVFYAWKATNCAFVYIDNVPARTISSDYIPLSDFKLLNPIPYYFSYLMKFDDGDPTTIVNSKRVYLGKENLGPIDLPNGSNSPSDVGPLFYQNGYLDALYYNGKNLTNALIIGNHTDSNEYHIKESIPILGDKFEFSAKKALLNCSSVDDITYENSIKIEVLKNEDGEVPEGISIINNNGDFTIGFKKNELSEDRTYYFKLSYEKTDESIDGYESVSSSVYLDITLTKYTPTFQLEDSEITSDYIWNFYADGTSLDYPSNSFKFTSNNRYLDSTYSNVNDLIEIKDSGELINYWAISYLPSESNSAENKYVYTLTMYNNNRFNKTTCNSGTVEINYLPDENKQNIFTLKYNQGYIHLHSVERDNVTEIISSESNRLTGVIPYYVKIKFEEFTEKNSTITDSRDVNILSEYFVNGLYDINTDTFNIISDSPIKDENSNIIGYKMSSWSFGDYESSVNLNTTAVITVKEEDTVDYDYLEYVIEDRMYPNETATGTIPFDVTNTLVFNNYLDIYNPSAVNYSERNPITLTFTRYYEY